MMRHGDGSRWCPLEPMGYSGYTTTSGSPPSSPEAVWVQSYALPAASSTNATSTSKTQIRVNGSIASHLLPVNAQRDNRAGRPDVGLLAAPEREVLSTVLVVSDSASVRLTRLLTKWIRVDASSQSCARNVRRDATFDGVGQTHPRVRPNHRSVFAAGSGGGSDG